MNEQLIRSSKNKLFFVHIPKCAGTSLKATLYKIFGKQQVLKVWNSKIGSDVSVKKFSTLEINKILSYPCIAGHLPYAEAKKKLFKNMENYFVCTLIRDPVDRVISLWNYISTHSEHPNHDKVLNMKFEEFIDEFAGNQQCRFICGHADASYALKIIHNEYDLVLPLNKYDYFVSEICERFNYKNQINDRKNTSKKSFLKKEISNNTLNIINRKMSEDIALYNTIFEDFY